MNGGYPFDGRETRNLHGSVATDLRVIPMWNNTKVTLEVKINVASCLFGIAAILAVLIS